MRLSTVFSHVALALSWLPSTHAAKSFPGSNLYFAAGLTVPQQTKLFEGLQSAGVKVLRVWLDGQGDNTKGVKTETFKGLEGNKPGVFDDTVLKRLDDVMANAYKYGIKLLISMHSYNALEGKKDYYGQKYGTANFYTNKEAKDHFKKRITHVLSHVNPHNGRPWSESSEYIFGFEAQNEAMNSNSNPSALATWQCDMAQSIKDYVYGNDSILVTTGGGSYLKTSLQDAYFNCPALDVLSIHAYDEKDMEVKNLKHYVDKALGTGKKLIMQEWGVCYTNAANKACNGGSPMDSKTRQATISKWAGNLNKAGIPWFYWQILPSKNVHQGWDYEIGLDDKDWGALKEAGLECADADAVFDFSPWLPSDKKQPVPTQTNGATKTGTGVAGDTDEPLPTKKPAQTKAKTKTKKTKTKTKTKEHHPTRTTRNHPPRSKNPETSTTSVPEPTSTSDDASENTDVSPPENPPPPADYCRRAV